MTELSVILHFWGIELTFFIICSDAVTIIIIPTIYKRDWLNICVNGFSIQPTRCLVKEMVIRPKDFLLSRSTKVHSQLFKFPKLFCTVESLFFILNQSDECLYSLTAFRKLASFEKSMQTLKFNVNPLVWPGHFYWFDANPLVWPRHIC